MNYEIVTLPAFRAVGLKWEGTYAEINPHLRNTINEMQTRADELEEKLEPNVLLGLSYHVIADGFAHYSMFKVSDRQKIPEGMLELEVPEWTYVKTTHPSGEDPTQTYIKLLRWLTENNYTPLKELGVEYYGEMLPIKHEYYPLDQKNSFDRYDIYIPIIPK